MAKSVTDEFLKLRSTGTPKLGEWNINYDPALALAKKNYKFIVTCWSNGDLCGYCTRAEACMMQPVFVEWMKTSDAYFVFQYSGDPDKGQTLHNWIFRGTGVTQYPGYRITIYDQKTGKIAYDYAIDGNTLRGNKIGEAGAKQMIANLERIFSHKPAQKKSTDVQPVAYKIRLNEKVTTKKVNKVLDAIDENNGYCPCQPKSEGTKCHCEDFIYKKKISVPCICKIYVKQKK